MDTPDDEGIGAVTVAEMGDWCEAERRAALDYRQQLASWVAELFRIDRLLRELLRGAEEDEAQA